MHYLVIPTSTLSVYVNNDNLYHDIVHYSLPAVARPLYRDSKSRILALKTTCLCRNKYAENNPIKICGKLFHKICGKQFHKICISYVYNYTNQYSSTTHKIDIKQGSFVTWEILDYSAMKKTNVYSEQGTVYQGSTECLFWMLLCNWR